jgi:hypothetical protein
MRMRYQHMLQTVQEVWSWSCFLCGTYGVTAIRKKTFNHKGNKPCSSATVPPAVLQARKYLEPRVPRIRLVARKRAAARICEYIRGTLKMKKLQARLFGLCSVVRLIQSTWRHMKVVRETQRALLLSQVLTYEARLTASNVRFVPTHHCDTCALPHWDPSEMSKTDLLLQFWWSSSILCVMIQAPKGQPKCYQRQASLSW